jgi:hypothetical protein
VSAIVFLTVAMGVPQAGATCDPTWTPMPVDDYAMPSVTDVAVRAETGWIVGYRATGGREPQPRLLGWNGASWSRATLPDLGTEAWLEGVDARTATDAWVVGYHVPDGNRRLLTLHWDGAAWTRIDALPTVVGRLRGVVALAEDDAWAVGEIGGTPLAIHWNGDSWARSDLPQLSGRIQSLYAVDASGPDDLWAVGQWREPGQTQPLLIHRTAESGWIETPAPSGIGTYNTALFDVAAVRAGRAWAVGQESNGAAALLLRWGGGSWRRVAVPAHITSLVDVSFKGRHGWAVGRSPEDPIALRWGDGTWTEDPPPAPVDTTLRMAAVAVGAGGRAVAVGVAGSRPAPFERCD